MANAQSVKRWNAISEMYRIKYMRLSISSIIFGLAWESFRNELRWTMPMTTMGTTRTYRIEHNMLMTMTTQFVEVTKYIYRVKCWLNWIKSVSQSVPTWINMFSLDFLFPGISSSDSGSNKNMEEEWVIPNTEQPSRIMLRIRMCSMLGIWILFKNGFIGCRLRPSFIPISLPSCSPFMCVSTSHFQHGTHTLSCDEREAHHIYLLILISRKGIKLWQKTREDKNNKQSNIHLFSCSLYVACTCIQLHGNAPNTIESHIRIYAQRTPIQMWFDTLLYMKFCNEIYRNGFLS